MTLLNDHAEQAGLTQRSDALDRVLRDTVEPAARQIDERHVFPQASLRALADAGLGCLPMPKELGGQSTRTSEYADTVSRIAAVCGSTSTVYMTQLHCAHPIHLQGNAEQIRRWIPAISSADAIGAIALTEPDAGSDVAAMRTTARRDGADYVINGSKIFISNGDLADVVVLFATVDPSLGKNGITAFLLEPATVKGFEAGKPMHKLGQKGASTVALSFDDCRIPAGAALGAEGEGYALLLKSVQKSRISAAAQGIGFATGAFEAAVRYFADHDLLSSRNRAAQDLQFAVATLRSEIFAARAMLGRVCDLVDDGVGDPTMEVSMAKLHCTALGVRVSNSCVELLGQAGDRIDLGVERRLRDAKITEIYDGTNQVQSMLIAREIRLASEGS
jgi:alkylation response protein AidB-like acyl-CoA dehydrogenase